MFSKSYYTMPIAFRWWHQLFHKMGDWKEHIVDDDTLIRICESCEIYETKYIIPPRNDVRVSNVAM